ncbi:MAG: rRNA pseudouridine synthase, partial [Anaerolineae bacterium]|nr:rRNA pseudouridine synthase [Anaerolineae bacterium]
MGKERIQKILAHAGVGSRRKCEELIAAGRVTINGRVARIGQSADAQTDKLVVDGKVIQTAEKKVYIALNKPPGVLSAASDDRGRKTVVDLVSVAERVYPIGRLDLESEGLILLTNDGNLALELSHPRYGHKKVYKVLVKGSISGKKLRQWRNGVQLADGYKTAPAEVEVEDKDNGDTWLQVVIKEGHKRQIRETAKKLGTRVLRLIRIQMGG